MALKTCFGSNLSDSLAFKFLIFLPDFLENQQLENLRPSEGMAAEGENVSKAQISWPGGNKRNKNEEADSSVLPTRGHVGRLT